jgi:hypothetical protein
VGYPAIPSVVHRADDFGNRWITEAPEWQPLLITPPFPEPVSGHSTFSAAAAEILTSFFGKHDDFSYPGPTGVTREFDSFWDAAKEARAGSLAIS